MIFISRIETNNLTLFPARKVQQFICVFYCSENHFGKVFAGIKVLYEEKVFFLIYLTIILKNVKEAAFPDNLPFQSIIMLT